MLKSAGTGGNTFILSFTFMLVIFFSFLMSASAQTETDNTDLPLYTLETDPCVPAGGFSDQDKDLIADLVEGGDDPDGDGLPNYQDPDSDGDGLSDRFERLYEFVVFTELSNPDSAAYFEVVDTENDNDPIHCLIQLREPGDKNFNGVYDFLEPAQYLIGANDPCVRHEGFVVGIGRDDVPVQGRTDTDGDTIADAEETDADTDGDGIPNYLDLDSDNDGLSDQFERQYNRASENNTDTDRDNDGIPGLYDADDRNHLVACVHQIGSPPVDINRDGQPDYLDPDCDNDGLLDSQEILYDGVCTTDTDSDTVPDNIEIQLNMNPAARDTDGGGADDAWELLHGSDPTSPSDDASLPLDLDVDNDGVPNSLEGNTEFNLDSDRDGLTDAQEAGLVDLDSDGLVDDQTDANNDGLPDVGEVLITLPDFDGDSIPDMQDRDSDQDGVLDQLEHNVFASPEGSAVNPSDADGDGSPNWLDLDSDNDGVFDSLEAQFYTEHHPDKDSDGKVDALKDADLDLIPDNIDQSYLPLEPDGDMDGIIDSADIDSTEQPQPQQISDGYGGYYTTTPVNYAVDDDGDGIINSRDPDSDNDGALDGLGSIMWIDNDGDSIPAIYDGDEQPVATDTTSNSDVVIEQDTPAQTPATGAANAEPVNGGGGTIGLWIACILFGFRRNRFTPEALLRNPLPPNN